MRMEPGGQARGRVWDELWGPMVRKLADTEAMEASWAGVGEMAVHYLPVSLAVESSGGFWGSNIDAGRSMEADVCLYPEML